MMNQVQRYSRRGFLAVASAGMALASPLRRLIGGRPPGDEIARHPASGTSNAAANTAPMTAPQPQAYSLTGGSDEVSFIASSQWMRTAIPDVPIGLNVSTSPDMSGAVPYPAATVSTVSGIVQHTVDGLSAKSRYYCQPTSADDQGSPVPFGQIFQGVTRPADDGSAYTIEMILGSCLSNYADKDSVPTPDIALEDALAQVPDRSVHLHLGDWGYWGQQIASTNPADYVLDLDKYVHANDLFTSLRTLLHSTNLEGVCISDHELELNGDGAGIHDSGHSIRELVAFQALFPIRTFGDTRSPRLHRGYFTDLTPHVRLVVSDFRSPERDDPSPDGSGQMWGQAQEDWLFTDAFATDKIILFVNETSWWRAPNLAGLRARDKPAAYPQAQDRFVDRLNGVGGDPVIDRFVWLGGDRHYCGYLAADDPNCVDGFAQFIGSGWQKDSLALQAGALMTWSTPVPATPDDRDAFPVAQYMHLSLAFDGAQGVSLTGRARYAGTHRLVTDAVTSKGSATVTSDTAAFTSADVGQLIGGPALRPAAKIAAVTSTTSATLTKRARATASPTRLTIAIDPAGWIMNDLPIDAGTTISFTV